MHNASTVGHLLENKLEFKKIVFKGLLLQGHINVSL